MRKPATGEPYAGKPPVRFGGRGGQKPSLPLSLTPAIYPCAPSNHSNGVKSAFPWWLEVASILALKMPLADHRPDLPCNACSDMERQSAGPNHATQSHDPDPKRACRLASVGGGAAPRLRDRYGAGNGPLSRPRALRCG